MNVLILTPDAVGSTLLQRMLTIYMQFHQFDRPVINLHELTNGLAKYYSPEFNRELVGKKAVKNWGYYQTLQEVVDLLSSVDHYKTSRLAHYHIVRRGDAVDQQIPFYNYLNENFYIISCRRKNVFEHALSMTINTITKKLNVYDAYEKLDTFYEIYRSGIELDPDIFLQKLEAYKEYVKWSEQYFNISSYFNYEKDVPNLEQYILKLPVFASQPKLTTWKGNFGIDFNDWNKMHYIRSDLNRLQLQSSATVPQLLLEQTDIVDKYQQQAPVEWPPVHSLEDVVNLPAELKQRFAKQIIDSEGIISMLNEETQQVLAPYTQGYQQGLQTINQMVELGIMISGPPIKKQTLVEKKKIVKNFDSLMDIYNQWASQNTEFANKLDESDLAANIDREKQFWNSIVSANAALPAAPPTAQ